MKILLIDDHALFRAGLRLLLRTIRPGAVVLEAATIGEALLLCEVNPELQVCLLDLMLRTENGLTALTRLKECAPEMAIVVVSRQLTGSPGAAPPYAWCHRTSGPIRRRGDPGLRARGESGSQGAHQGPWH